MLQNVVFLMVFLAFWGALGCPSEPPPGSEKAAGRHIGGFGLEREQGVAVRGGSVRGWNPPQAISRFSRILGVWNSVISIKIREQNNAIFNRFYKVFRLGGFPCAQQ